MRVQSTVLEKTFQVKKLILTVCDGHEKYELSNPLLTFSYRGFGDDSLSGLDTLPVASTDAEEGSPYRSCNNYLEVLMTTMTPVR